LIKTCSIIPGSARIGVGASSDETRSRMFSPNRGRNISAAFDARRASSTVVRRAGSRRLKLSNWRAIAAARSVEATTCFRS